MFIGDLLEESLTGITVLYGPSASGKSTACVEAIQGKCAYIATSSNFSVERLATIHPDFDLGRVVLFSPTDMVEVERAVSDAVRLSSALKLIVIDSLGTYVRSSERRSANLALERILSRLRLSACPVVIVTDAIDKPTAGEPELRLVGGDLLRVSARTIIELDEGKATVKKHPVLSGRVWSYKIVSAGLQKV
jgi:GTPase SAR1 family protein